MNIEKEFTQLYNTHAPKVYRLCLGYAAGDEDLAKEWQQQTFIKVWKHRKSFQEKSAISTWIYRIAVNTCLGDLRKAKKQVPLNETYLAATESSESQNTNAQIQKMYSCIEQLTANNKTIILMELEDIPQATIAETLGMAHGSLRTRLTRIRQSLLKCIQNGK
ncbi:DNA-directed RNA polymerase sigma-70 factor [Croceivirga lutea]|uniref:RNA polymerase sigma factor n=1 Tax=Croceivirga lutea TaxID=1775167 RepID=UPI0016395D19|nr:RNA polymerase sigma factor [Croceivirga lutea]GGG45097.1 DNA-directed RNA polymerase sigma-70 factor [Croceivirga lutea]